MSETVTAKEAIRKLVPLIAKTTGYKLSQEWINFMTTWLDTSVELVEMAKAGKIDASRKVLLVMLVDRLNALGALAFVGLKQETGKCVTSMIGTGISGAKFLGLSISEVGIPLAMLEATSLWIDILSMVQDCEAPATELHDKVVKSYDDWLDDTSRNWAVEFNQMLYQMLGPNAVLPAF